MTSNNNSSYETSINRIYTKAFDFLAYKQSTKKELEQKLYKYLFKENLTETEKETIKESVVNRFIEEGFINDEKYAKDFVSSCLNSSKPRSMYQIKKYLIQKGVGYDFIDSSLNIWTEEVELENAILMAKKKRFSSDKLIKYLQSKGFSYHTATCVIDKTTPKA